jgi:hypothetical protein
MSYHTTRGQEEETLLTNFLVIHGRTPWYYAHFFKKSCKPAKNSTRKVCKIAGASAALDHTWQYNHGSSGWFSVFLSSAAYALRPLKINPLM